MCGKCVAAEASLETPGSYRCRVTEPRDHGLKLMKPGAKITLTSLKLFSWVFCNNNKRLSNMIALHAIPTAQTPSCRPLGQIRDLSVKDVSTHLF
jgi:hypothetical protein